MKRFGLRLEELRGENTQKQFAELLDIPLNTYTNWVRGVREPSAAAIVNLCTQLDVSADWLLGLSDVRTTTQSVEPPMIGLNKRQSLQRDDVAFELAAIRRQLEQQQREIAALKELNQTQTACCA